MRRQLFIETAKPINYRASMKERAHFNVVGRNQTFTIKALK